MRTAVLGAITLSSLLVTAAANAQTLGEPTPAATSGFGNPGQVSIASDFGLDFEYESEGESSSLRLAPAIDYFIAPQLSLGGQVVFGYASNDPVSRTTLAIGPRVGFNIPLTPMFSLFPRVGFFFTHISDSASSGSVSVSRSANFLSLFLFAPFLFHPVQHFYIGFGPAFGGNVAGGEAGDRYLTVGLNSTVGGYFDW